MHVLLSAIFPVGRTAATLAQPFFFTAVRMTLAGVILVAYYLICFKKFSSRFKEAIIPLVIFTITGVYITNVAEFWALQFVPAAKASLMYSLSPFVAAFFSYTMFQEKMTFKKFWGMAIGVTGFMLMMAYEAPREISFSSAPFVLAGEIALIIAAIATAYGWIIMRRKMLEGILHPVEAIGISMLGGGILAFIHSLCTESWSPIPLKEPWDIPNFSLNLLIAILCSSVFGYVLYTFLLRTYTATFLSFSGFIQPVSAALLGWFFLGETITWQFMSCALLVFLGLYVFYMEELRQGYVSTAIESLE